MEHDVVIVGAGPAGLCLARALAGTGLRIHLLERQPRESLADPGFDGREIALTHASVRALRELGVWERIPAEEASPLRDALVLDGSSTHGLRIDHRDGRCGELGWLVPNHCIRRAAFETVRDSAAVTLETGVRVTGIGLAEPGIRLDLDDGRALHARLVVAADSRYSETRRAMGIAASMHDFGKTMLVCRMAHERPHDQVAWEWFDYGQTLALLPLNGNRSSVVLTLPHALMQPLLALDEAAFAREIELRFQHRLGHMRLLSTRHAYPLVGVYPRAFVAARFVLVGDAAVGMHPVTAHGFNFGLGGVVRLARLLRAAHAAGGDIASPALLARYEREHRRATRPLYLATEAIATLFTRDHLPARIVRRMVLRLSQGVPPFRRALAGALAQDA
jgi:ubiquinone biosynthesis UbiH/UbiF/VisC/COQ6 family hydroxylase